MDSADDMVRSTGTDAVEEEEGRDIGCGHKAVGGRGNGEAAVGKIQSRFSSTGEAWPCCSWSL